MPGLPAPLTLADPGHERQLRARRHRRRSESATAWAFISPAVLVILGLSVVPVIWSVLLSFQADDLVTPSRWVGLDNYRALTKDPHFSQAVWNTLEYTVLYVPLSMVLGLVLALVLNQRIRLVGLYRTLIFVPFVISATAQGVLFSFILDPQFGVANSLLHSIGVSPRVSSTIPDRRCWSWWRSRCGAAPASASWSISPRCRMCRTPSSRPRGWTARAGSS